MVKVMTEQKISTQGYTWLVKSLAVGSYYIHHHFSSIHPPPLFFFACPKIPDCHNCPSHLPFPYPTETTAVSISVPELPLIPLQHLFMLLLLDNPSPSLPSLILSLSSETGPFFINSILHFVYFSIPKF